jgi:hypothetical protein
VIACARQADDCGGKGGSGRARNGQALCRKGTVRKSVAGEDTHATGRKGRKIVRAIGAEHADCALGGQYELTGLEGMGKAGGAHPDLSGSLTPPSIGRAGRPQAGCWHGEWSDRN